MYATEVTKTVQDFYCCNVLVVNVMGFTNCLSNVKDTPFALRRVLLYGYRMHGLAVFPFLLS